MAATTSAMSQSPPTAQRQLRLPSTHRAVFAVLLRLLGMELIEPFRTPDQQGLPLPLTECIHKGAFRPPSLCWRECCASVLGNAGSSAGQFSEQFWLRVLYARSAPAVAHLAPMTLPKEAIRSTSTELTHLIPVSLPRQHSHSLSTSFRSGPE